jgi:hypothetical protein
MEMWAIRGPDGCFQTVPVDTEAEAQAVMHRALAGANPAVLAQVAGFRVCRVEIREVPTPTPDPTP